MKFLQNIFKLFAIFLLRGDTIICLYFISELHIPLITDEAILPVPINPNFINVFSTLNY